MTAPEETREADYTPTTHEAQAAWINYRLDYNRFGRENFGRGDAIGQEFDRWLASVKAEAAATILDKVANSIDRMYAGSDGTMQDLAWIAGVDAAARKVHAFAGDYRSEVK